MKQLLLGLTMVLGLVAGSKASAEGVIPSASGDYCQDQALEVLKGLYGEDIKVQTVYVDGAGEGVHYWMKTNLCDGYIVASFVRNASCKVAHYGFVPNYMKRVWAEGQCLEVLPSDLY